MSFYTSLSGLKAAQTDLSTISNNIANVGTVGFKQSRTDFGDLIASSAFQAQGSVIGQGTQLKSVTQEFTQGTFESTDRSLDLAVSGQGFFITKGALTGGQVAYTRNGAFQVDSNNYVSDSSGAFLQVLPVDTLGNVTATGTGALENLQLPAANGTATATGTINTSVTLPSSADLPADRTAYATSGYTFNPNDPNSYNQASSTTVYDSAGNAIPATIYYVHTSAPSGTNTDSTWAAHLFVGNQEVSAGGTATTPPTPLTLTFDSSGQMTSPGTTATSFSAATPTGASAPITLSLAFGSGTNQANSGFSVTALSQDGNTVGKLSNVSVGSDGLVTASYSDGTTKALGKLALASFSNPSGLQQLGDAKWAVSGNSGDPIISSAGSDGLGSIQSGALEQSNVDLTTELVALIAAQRNFQANAKAIDTDNQMTSVIVNMQN